MSDRLIHGFLDNEPVTFDFQKQEFAYKGTGAKLSNGKAILENRKFTVYRRVVIAGRVYSQDAGRRQFISTDGEEKMLPFDECAASGVKVDVPKGDEFRSLLWKEQVAASERAAKKRGGPPEPAENCYLDNVPYYYSREGETFRSGFTSGVELTLDDAVELKLHFANLRIVEIGNKLYYHDERLREFRRVGNGSESLTYDDYDKLDEQGIRLSIPMGPGFRRLMQKESKFLLEMVGGKRERDRG